MGSLLKPFGKDSKEARIFRAVEQGDVLRLKPLAPCRSELLEIRNKYGWTPLHHAIVFNRKNIVEYLVSAGANIYSKDVEGGEMPLNFAVRQDHAGIAEILIAKGADYMGRGEHTLPPLHLAAIMGCLNSAKLLISLGAEVNMEFKVSLCKPDASDINSKENIENRENSEILAAVHIQRGLIPLHLAIHGGHEDIVKLLIANGAEVNARDSDYDTPLIKAAQAGAGGIIVALLKAGADVNAADMTGKTPLHHLVMTGSIDDITLAVNEGANVNAADNNGMTPLFFVPLSERSREKAEFLISRGADINIKDGEGTSLLQHAVIMEDREMLEVLTSHKFRAEDVFDFVIMGDTEITEKLTDEKPEQLNSQNPAGFTPLHFAAMTGNKPMLDMLLKKGADVNLLTKNGQSPLHRASSVEVAQALIDAGAKVVSDALDFSPILLPLKSIEVMDLLISKGANVNTGDTSGLNPLITAAVNEDIEKIEYLISKGASVDEKLLMGGTALHWVLFDGKEKSAAALIKAGASPHLTNHSGETPLHIAANRELTESAKLLLERGVNVNEKDNEGITALHYAALGMGSASEEAKKEMIKLLISAGADANAMDNLNRTPRDYAISRGFIGILDLLQ